MKSHLAEEYWPLVLVPAYIVSVTATAVATAPGKLVKKIERVNEARRDRYEAKRRRATYRSK